MNYIVLTRPHEKSLELAKALKNELNKKTLISPMLEIKLTSQKVENINNYSALIFTSANAVRSFCKLNKNRTIPVYNVGLVTHKLLEEEGFETIHTVQNSVRELPSILSKNTYDDPLLYCRGDIVTHDLKDLIKTANIVELILYQSKKNQDFSKETEACFINSEVSEVIFFSKRTIEAFYSIIQKHPKHMEILKGITRTRFLCLTNDMIEYALKIADNMNFSIVWKDMRAAKIPTQDSIIEELK